MMTEQGKKVWKELEKMGWSNEPKDFHLEYFEDIIEATKKVLDLGTVSSSLVADIRNKLGSPKNLCAMLKDREVEPFIGNDKRNKMIDSEIDQTLKNIDYLSNL